jgi:sigma-B regulation protein RsbU (phosphoserine phosphatase)
VIVVLVVFIFTFIYSSLFTRPIRILAEAAATLSSGDYSQKVDTKKFSGEFIDLGASFNHMSQTIHEYNLHLEDMVKKRTEEVLEANKKMKKDLEMAQKIQMKLIPENVELGTGIDFKGSYYPMEDLGGDLYDIFKLDDNRVGMFIIDVCGHGVSAAFITTMAKVSFSNHSKKSLSAGEVAKLVNHEMSSVIGDPGTFLTCIYAIYDNRTGELNYANCGHNDGLIMKKEGTFQSLPPTGPVIGVVPGLEYPEVTLKMEKGDLLFLYTDGIIEARNSKRELFGLEVLLKILQENKDLPVKDLPGFIMEKVTSFSNHSEQDDDMTILALKIGG